MHFLKNIFRFIGALFIWLIKLAKTDFDEENSHKYEPRNILFGAIIIVFLAILFENL